MADPKAFDARETLMCENSLAPDSRWRTVSLVAAVRAIVAWSPASPGPPWPLGAVASNPGSLLEAFQAATVELTRRGLDADSLVRYGMRNEIAGSLLGLLLVRDLKMGTPDLVHQRGIDLDAWSSVLPGKLEVGLEAEIAVDQVVRHVAEVARLQVPLLLGWIMRAPLDELVALPAPNREDLVEPAPLDSEDLQLYEQYAWLVDRFSTTSPRDWLTSSLLYEFRWQAEQEPPPCRAELMLDREVSEQQLNAEIARRTALNIPNGVPDPEAVLASDMAGHARALLRLGRCGEAAALFEFAARRRPTDAEARNNLGFCLIPRDPKRALHDLEAAAHMGYGHPVVNLYNRVCCYLSQRQPRAAVAAADAYWAARDDRPGGATLWIWHADGSWEIGDFVDPHLALADLVVKISQAEGWREDEKRWRARADSRQNLT
jgi:hypothetical protein